MSSLYDVNHVKHMSPTGKGKLWGFFHFEITKSDGAMCNVKNMTMNWGQILDIRDKLRLNVL